MSVEEKIKQYIIKKNIQQKILSEKTGIPTSKLCLALNGKRRLTFAEYELLCGALNVPVDKFLSPKTCIPAPTPGQ